MVSLKTKALLSWTNTGIPVLESVSVKVFNVESFYVRHFIGVALLIVRP